MTSPPNNRSTIIVSLVIGLVCAALIGSIAWSAHIAKISEGKILPNVSVAGVTLGGLSKEQAANTLRQTLGQDQIRSIKVQIKDKTYTLEADGPTGSFVEPSSSLVEKAFLIGRSANPAQNTWDRLRLSLWSKAEVSLSVDVDPERLRQALEPQLAGVLRAPTDARLSIQNEPLTLTIVPEETGASLNWDESATRIEQALNRRTAGIIELVLEETEPNLNSRDLEATRTQAEAWLLKPALTLVATSTINKSWQLTASTVASWINVTSTVPHQAEIRLDSTLAERTFRDWLGTSARAAQDGELELDEQGKLKSFVAPKEGLGPNTAQTLQNIQTAWLNQATSTTLVIETRAPVIRGEAAERLGIRELIGRGTSDFSGSPSNRRKNIKLGAERVHGTILLAGEEFSMIKTLGPIDGEHGWLPELVIKGNRTLPEFGGGLCQIGTTAFRAAMNTGLLITERRNHSYRVRYYEPAGTDATIYDPSPDFKFKNDTPHAILITTELQGDIVVFSFWGTEDGREAVVGKSVITNITAPPPKKLIETTDLPVGQTKCTETAHAGATAKVDYTVNYGNGETKTITFTSVYRPWQAVCLVGVASLTPAAETGAAAVDQTGINNLN